MSQGDVFAMQALNRWKSIENTYEQDDAARFIISESSKYSDIIEDLPEVNTIHDYLDSVRTKYQESLFESGMNVEKVAESLIDLTEVSDDEFMSTRISQDLYAQQRLMELDYFARDIDRRIENGTLGLHHAQGQIHELEHKLEGLEKDNYEMKPTLSHIEHRLEESKDKIQEPHQEQKDNEEKGFYSKENVERFLELIEKGIGEKDFSNLIAKELGRTKSHSISMGV